LTPYILPSLLAQDADEATDGVLLPTGNVHDLGQAGAFGFGDLRDFGQQSHVVRGVIKLIVAEEQRVLVAVGRP
jgi:hypothetical protein